MRGRILEMMDYVHDVCRDHGITYFLMFGSLLGAVRHKGFIPWDDDFDICMPKDDYRRFIEIVRSRNEYGIVNPDTNPDYYFAFSRLSDPKTKLVFRDIREIHGLGVFIDLFPIHEAPPKEEIPAWSAQYFALGRKVRLTTPSSARYQHLSFRKQLGRILHFPKRMKLGVRHFPEYRREWLDLLERYNGTDSEYCAIGNAFHICTRKFFGESVLLPFEGREYCAPRDYDFVLRELYGDYMQLPPPEKRRSFHHFTAYWK